MGDTVGKGNEFDQPLEPPARFANKEQLRKMVQEGGRLQWHSRTHKDLTRVDSPSLREEELAVPVEFREMDPKGFHWFAYPHGKHTPEIIA